MDDCPVNVIRRLDSVFYFSSRHDTGLNHHWIREQKDENRRTTKKSAFALMDYLLEDAPTPAPKKELLACLLSTINRIFSTQFFPPANPLLTEV